MPVGTTVAAAAGRLTEEAFVDRFGALPRSGSQCPTTSMQTFVGAARRAICRSHMPYGPLTFGSDQKCPIAIRRRAATDGAKAR